MKNDYNFMLINNDTRAIVFNGTDVITNYSKLPKKLIQIIAYKLGLYVSGETCMHTGKFIYKASLKANDKGGVIGLFSTYSRAKFNKFIVKYVRVS